MDIENLVVRELKEFFKNFGANYKRVAEELPNGKRRDLCQIAAKNCDDALTCIERGDYRRVADFLAELIQLYEQDIPFFFSIDETSASVLEMREKRDRLLFLILKKELLRLAS